MKLVDLNASVFKFEPGDRVVVKLRSYDPQVISRVHAIVQRWAGKDVEVLVIHPDLIQIAQEKF